jgi:pyruvate/2-oxoglutarate dehydrogenase complex dihydrolipoamide dehydrogenase (E3) component
MSHSERFEILVLGSGMGGRLLAWHMALAGRRTAVVERRWIGGSCPNINCLPSKNEIWSAKVASLVRRSADYGANIGRVAIDMAKVRDRKRKMVDDQIAANLRNYKESGTELIMGSGQFVGPKTLEVQLNDGGTQVLVGAGSCHTSSNSIPRGRSPTWPRASMHRIKTRTIGDDTDVATAAPKLGVPEACSLPPC